MGLRDVAGIFSRQLVIGFFLPVFFALVALWQLLTDHLLPDFLSDPDDEGTQLLVIGGIALFGALLLSGLHYNVLRVFEGYPLVRGQDRWLLKRVYGFALGRQRKRFHELQAARRRTSKAPAAARARSLAKQELAQQYPADCGALLPTRFGNVVRSFERHPRSRWGLNGVVVWPRMELLLNEQQLDLQATAETDVAFFVNSALVSALAGCLFVVDWLEYSELSRTWSWLLLFIPFVLAVLAYRAAVGAAVRWGDEVRAVFDMYRFDLYRRLGVRLPETHEEEIVIAGAVNSTLAYGDALPGAVRDVEGVAEKVKPRSKKGKVGALALLLALARSARGQYQRRGGERGRARSLPGDWEDEDETRRRLR